jgi:uncharacterized integral membrane protein
MLRKIVTAIVLIPLAVIIIGFAVANRQIVTVSFDPFDAAHPAYRLTLPLFAIVFVLLITGVIIGGAASWLGQRRWRHSSRRFDAEARALRAENEALRRRTAAAPAAPSAPGAEPKQPLILPPTVP